MSIQSVTASRKVAMCLYGDPGVGKTALLGEHASTLIIRPPQDHTDSVANPAVKEWVVDGWAAMDEALEHAREHPTMFDWRWLDSISLFQDVGVDDIWTSVVAEKPHRKKYGRDKGEYGRNMERLAEWCRHMVALPGFNFGITAHPFEATKPDGEVIFAPYVQGKNMAFKIAGMMNLVGLMRVQGDDRVLDFNSNEDFLAHNKLGLFPPRGRLKNPTMAALMAEVERVRSERTGTRRRGTTRRKTKCPRRTRS